VKPNYWLWSLVCLLLSVPLAWRLVQRRSSQPPVELVRCAAWHVPMPDAGDPTWRAAFATGQHGLGRALAAVVQRQAPDLLLLTGLPAEAAAEVAAMLRSRYFAIGQEGLDPIDYEFVWTGGPGSQLVVCSRHPILTERVRDFAALPWGTLPGAAAPPELAAQPLWAGGCAVVPIGIGAVAANHVLQVVCVVPDAATTSAVGVQAVRRDDGLRGLGALVGGESADWLVDAAGRRGGLAAQESFVVLGPLGCDPEDGPFATAAQAALLGLPALQDPAPRSAGAAEAHQLQWGANAAHRGDPGRDTADLDDTVGVGLGNLRLDYALAGRSLEVLGSGVFWPGERAGAGPAASVSPHHLVWIDVRAPR
jgi:hypothetical protein